jgi:hypothetical protein
MNLISTIESNVNTDTGSLGFSLSASQRKTAMETWLHDAWVLATTNQYGLSGNTINGGSDFTMKKGTIDADGDITDSESDGISTDWATLGFDQISGWHSTTPTGFLKAILTNTTCFPWANFVLADNTKSRYIIIIDGSIFRHEHSESSDAKVNLQRMSAAKNAVGNYATSYCHTSLGNGSEATARMNTGNTSITNNLGDY